MIECYWYETRKLSAGKSFSGKPTALVQCGQDRASTPISSKASTMAIHEKSDKKSLRRPLALCFYDSTKHARLMFRAQVTFKKPLRKIAAVSANLVHVCGKPPGLKQIGVSRCQVTQSGRPLHKAPSPLEIFVT